MAWVVTAWKPEALAAAGREARRRLRAADREVGDAAAYLTVLEELGADLHERVRAQQRELPRPLPILHERAAPGTPDPAPGEITARRGRATMGDSRLGELFRSTG